MYRLSNFVLFLYAVIEVDKLSSRLRVTLCATHTRDDLVKLTAALSGCINLKEISVNGSTGYAIARM